MSRTMTPSPRTVSALIALTVALGVALMLVTQDPACAAMADRVIRLRDGWVEQHPVPSCLGKAA